MFESRMYGNVMRNSIVCSIGIEKLFESIVHETLSKHICTHDTYNNDYELNHYTMEQRNGEKERKKNHLSEYAPTGTNSSSKLLFSSWSKKETSKKKIVSMCLRNQNGIELENRCHMNEALCLPYQCVFFLLLYFDFELLFSCSISFWIAYGNWLCVNMPVELLTW